MLKGLKALILERFSPGQYLPMIIVFTLANALFYGFRGYIELNPSALFAAFFLMLSAFFRLRLFDEIKDYDTDLKINPTRPLARGAISIRDTKRLLLALLVFEAALSLYLGPIPFLIHFLSVAFSLLMYEEFFIGDVLRPHLTTYAVFHTFVSVLLGLSAATAASGINPFLLHPSDMLFFIMNWAYFNLFEFARKSYSKIEERPGVPTYSGLFTPIGAGLLSLSQMGLGLLLLLFLVKTKIYFFIAALGIIYSFFCLMYMMRPSLFSAKVFRLASGVYLLAHYSILIWIFWR